MGFDARLLNLTVFKTIPLAIAAFPRPRRPETLTRHQWAVIFLILQKQILLGECRQATARPQYRQRSILKTK